MSRDSEAVTVLISPVVAASGFDLEDVIVHRSGNRSVVRVLVDRDGGSELDVLAELSRDISTVIDDAPDPVLGALSFTLEVTSPGVDRPLTSPRHWRRAHGRKVVVALRSESDAAPEELRARIGRLSVDETGVDLVVGGTGRHRVRRIALADITSAVVQVDFSGPTATERELCGLDENTKGRA